MEREFPALTPCATVLNAWRQLEKTSIKKFVELSRKKNRFDVSSDTAIAFFEHSDGLAPNTEKSLSEFKWLRNKVVHPGADYISQDVAAAFVEASHSLCAQIDAMTSTPSAYLGLFTQTHTKLHQGSSI